MWNKVHAKKRHLGSALAFLIGKNMIAKNAIELGSEKFKSENLSKIKNHCSLQEQGTMIGSHISQGLYIYRSMQEHLEPFRCCKKDDQSYSLLKLVDPLDLVNLLLCSFKGGSVDC